MKTILIARSVWCALLGFSALASAVELQVVDGGIEESTGRQGWQWSDSTSRRVLAKEPDFVSDKPVWFALALGNGKDRFISGALDESKGTGTGYDTLYLDANNNGDLTDDPPIKNLKTTNNSPQNTNIEFDSVTLRVAYHDGTSRQLRVKIQGQCYSYGDENDRSQWNFSYAVEQHLEGQVQFGDKTMLVGIYDACPQGQGRIAGELNGCFDDYGVDRLRIDLDGDGKLDPVKEDFPLSKVIAVDGKLWQLDVDSAGRKLTVEPCKLPTARVELRGAFDASSKIESGTLELLSGQGYAFRADLGQQGTLIVPGAKYMIEDGSLCLADAKGAKWTAKFSYPKTMRVTAGQTAPLVLGKPFTLQAVVPDALVAGRAARVTHRLVGAGGEAYSGFLQERKQLAPTVTLTDSEGIKILEGPMEFG